MEQDKPLWEQFADLGKKLEEAKQSESPSSVILEVKQALESFHVALDETLFGHLANEAALIQQIQTLVAKLESTKNGANKEQREELRSLYGKLNKLREARNTPAGELRQDRIGPFLAKEESVLQEKVTTLLKPKPPFWGNWLGVLVVLVALIVVACLLYIFINTMLALSKIPAPAATRISENAASAGVTTSSGPIPSATWTQESTGTRTVTRAASATRLPTLQRSPTAQRSSTAQRSPTRIRTSTPVPQLVWKQLLYLKETNGYRFYIMFENPFDRLYLPRLEIRLFRPLDQKHFGIAQVSEHVLERGSVIATSDVIALKPGIYFARLYGSLPDDTEGYFINADGLRDIPLTIQ